MMVMMMMMMMMMVMMVMMMMMMVMVMMVVVMVVKVMIMVMVKTSTSSVIIRPSKGALEPCITCSDCDNILTFKKSFNKWKSKPPEQFVPQ